MLGRNAKTVRMSVNIARSWVKTPAGYFFKYKPQCSQYITTTMVTEPKRSIPLITKLTIKHDPKPVPFIPYLHNLLPQRHI
jgi:hypothetical protein